MASRYWIASTASTWNSTANWSATSGGSGGSSVPTGTDDVTFDGNGTGNCTCDVAITTDALTVLSGYFGTIDLADSSYAHTINGDVVLDGTGGFDLGNATTTLYGDFDFRDQAGWVDGTSTINLEKDGCQIIGGGSGKAIYKCNINNNAEVPATIGDLVTCRGDVVLAAGKTLTLNTGGHFFIVNSTMTVLGVVDTYAGRLYITAGSLVGSGSLIGSGKLVMKSNSSIAFTGIGINTEVDPQAGTTMVTGDTKFLKNVTFQTDSGESATFDNTGNHDLTFAGDIIQNHTGTFNWLKGGGTITLEGSSTQYLDFNGESVEDIEIDKTAGDVIFEADVTTDSLTLVAGSLGIDSSTITTNGNVTIGQGTDVYEVGTGSSLVVGGNFAINGTASNPCTFQGVDLDITGTAIARGTYVTNSDASAGTAVDATIACFDEGGNTNWTFFAVGGTWIESITSSIAPSYTYSILLPEVL